MPPTVRGGARSVTMSAWRPSRSKKPGLYLRGLCGWGLTYFNIFLHIPKVPSGLPDTDILVMMSFRVLLYGSQGKLSDSNSISGTVHDTLVI